MCLVGSYVDVKKESHGEDDIATDLMKQTHATFKTVARPKGVMGNQDVVAILRNLITVRAGKGRRRTIRK